jgi:aminomethyltransferase
VYCAASAAVHVWDALLTAGTPHGLVPAGLAARDTLRLEAGMPLYGNELGPSVTPYDANLGRVVKLGKPGPFVGRSALEARAAAAPREVLVGLVVRSSKRVPRHGYPVLANRTPCGSVTSGAPSPTLGMPIAMAYVTPSAAGLAEVSVDIRGSAIPAELVSLPFYRRRQ